jgi:hypothetical protein
MLVHTVCEYKEKNKQITRSYGVSKVLFHKIEATGNCFFSPFIITQIIVSRLKILSSSHCMDFYSSFYDYFDLQIILVT